MTAPRRLDVHTDARGLVFEPLSGPELAGMRNVHLVLTEPGHVRGNHRHARGTERMVVLGPATVRVRRAGQVEETRVPAGEAWRFEFPPGVAHAVLATGERTGLLVAFRDTPHDPDQPDTFRDTLFTDEELGRS